MAYLFCPHKCGNQYDWSADVNSSVPCPNCGRTVWVDRLAIPYDNPSLTARVPLDASRYELDREPDTLAKVCSCPTSWLSDAYRRGSRNPHHLTVCDLYVEGGNW